MKAKFYCPIQQTWTISENKILNMISKGRLMNFYSEKIEVSSFPNIKHSLLFEVDPPRINQEQSVSFYIVLYGADDDDLEIHGKLSLSVKLAAYSTSFDNLFTLIKGKKALGGKIGTTEDLFEPKRRFIVDGNLVVEMKGILIFNEDMPKIIHLENVLCQGLWEQNDKDFRMVARDNGIIKIHKIVLRARSPFFEAMFNARREEAETDTLNINDFDLKIVRTAVEFFYHRNIFNDLDIIDAFELLRFASEYNIADL
uniref:BTB domain-containing protein n=1 Tax=Panagrolaimus sp. ES5 TaxID=591445 RepID=A0AC34FMV3_9BILA